LSSAAQKPASLTPDSPFVDLVAPSPNIGERRGGGRIDFLVLHYTGLESARRSLEVLCDPRCEVSCHYLIDEDGTVTQMVREADRAWHAGLSAWHGIRDVNSHSVGIEIQNPGHTNGYPDFPDVQMRALEDLAGDIISRHAIRPEHVLAHSDIAPQRKIDPGEKFDWARLHRSGIGHWVAPRPTGQPAALSQFRSGQASLAVASCQERLAAYGYDVALDGILDERTRKVIAAFQRHFRPALVDGLPDTSTIDTLDELLAALGG
jgi:N-acetylmuramoyl-L-alanine amidase